MCEPEESCLPDHRCALLHLDKHSHSITTLFSRRSSDVSVINASPLSCSLQATNC